MDLVEQQHFHHLLGVLGGVEEAGCRAADHVADVAPQGDVVDDFLLAEVDALAGEGEPDEGGGEDRVAFYCPGSRYE